MSLERERIRWMRRILTFVILFGIGVMAYAEEGDPDQLYLEGVKLLTSDDSTEADISAGLANLEKAADIGSPYASYALGLIYEYGYYLEQDYERALYYYYQGVQYGDIDSLYKIGYFAETGKGMQPDYDLAISIYQVAANNGHAESMKSLAMIYLQALDDPEMTTAAKELLEQAADLGDTEAMLSAGWCYEFGIGTIQDYKLAGEWFSKGLEVTDDEIFYGSGAQEILDKLALTLKNTDSPSEEFFKDFYRAIWVRKHQNSRETANSRHIATVLSSMYGSLDAGECSRAVFECIEWIYAHEPELEAVTEEITYGGGSTTYERSIVAQMFFDTGYQAFEERNYAKAEEEYRKCVEIDSYDLPARFELVETYLASGKIDEAKQELNDLVNYVKADVDKAKYYRRIGFIAIDEGDYELGGACMLYSLQYEESENALVELKYIQEMTGVYPNYDEEKIIEILKDNKVHMCE